MVQTSEAVQHERRLDSTPAHIQVWYHSTPPFPPPPVRPPPPLPPPPVAPLSSLKAKKKADWHALQVNFMPVYAEHLRNIIKQGVDRKDNFDKPLEGFKVAVDPGNGAGGYFATDVLQPLGCDVSGAFH